ncbi:hypothetical protein [Lactiplantibacillus plantarum]|uniref:hypothetical protein n=1 Tax=Lactiplantibacillus plantarum TaxID=1590 RepID=UPI00214BCAE8|nr:hypothetical protein [Lactiplantibacillus plantarum]
MKNTFKKLTLTLMAAGTLFATSVSASADTTTTKHETTSTTLVNKVTRILNSQRVPRLANRNMI